MPGFRALAEEMLRSATWPLAIKGVQVAEDWEYSVSRGCPIQAELIGEGCGVHKFAA